MTTQPNKQYPAFPRAFVEHLKSVATQTMIDWCAANDAPEAFRELVNAIDWLGYLLAHEPTDRDNQELAGCIADYTRAIVAMGGKFFEHEYQRPGALYSANFYMTGIEDPAPATLANWLSTYDRLSAEDREEAQAWMRGIVGNEREARLPAAIARFIETLDFPDDDPEAADSAGQDRKSMMAEIGLALNTIDAEQLRAVADRLELHEKTRWLAPLFRRLADAREA